MMSRNRLSQLLNSFRSGEFTRPLDIDLTPYLGNVSWILLHHVALEMQDPRIVGCGVKIEVVVFSAVQDFHLGAVIEFYDLAVLVQLGSLSKKNVVDGVLVEDREEHFRDDLLQKELGPEA